MEPRTETITVRPEVTLAAETHDVPAGPVQAALAWLPAMGVPASYHRPFGAALAARGVATTVVDLRGQGASTPPNGRSTDFGYRELIEEDCPAALALLDGRHQDVPLLIGGHSLGGQVAALYAARGDRELAGLVLVATQSVYWRGYSGWNALRILAGTQLAGDLAAVWGYWPGDRLGFGGRQPKRLMQDWARLGRTARWQVGDIDYDPALASLDLPVLAVSIEGDRDAPVSAVDRLCDQLQAARVHRWHCGGDQADRLTHLNWPRKAAEPIAEQVADWIRTNPVSR